VLSKWRDGLHERTRCPPTPYQRDRAALFDRALRDYGGARRIVAREGAFHARWLDERGERHELPVGRQVLRGMRWVLRSLYRDLWDTGEQGGEPARDILLDVRRNGS